jgi:hypothetical protein
LGPGDYAVLPFGQANEFAVEVSGSMLGQFPPTIGVK